MSTSKDSTAYGCDSLPIACSTKTVAHSGLDYLTQLLESNGFNNVLIIVDHLTRMAHFLPCTEIIIAEETAALFLQGVHRLHGLPRVLISDRDPIFVRGF
jgi:hypothetical protein